MKNKKWGILSDDGRIEFDLMTMRQDDKGVTSTGLLLFDGKEQGMCKITTTPDIFTAPRKPKPAKRMIAYVLAYHLGLFITRGNSIKATEMVCAWLETNEGDVRRALREHAIPKKSIIILNADPSGIIVLLEPEKITFKGDYMSYSGFMRAWKEGDKNALVGVATLKDIERGLVVDSPLITLNNKKIKKNKRGKSNT